MAAGQIIKKKLYIAEPYYSVCRFIEETLQRHGFEAWLVGGSVRDLIISGKLSDLDYTTNATPDEVQKIFPRTFPVGIKFGTVLVLHKGCRIEITTYRADADYHDGRRPASVQFSDSLEKDIMRRDFTVNGLAYNVTRSELADYCGGIDDLNAKILRTIGEPMQRFREDGLRPIRGCRIAAKLDLVIAAETLVAMRQCVEITAKVAAERFYDEWRKTLRMRNRRAYWHNLIEAHILPAFLPHIAQAFVGTAREQFLREIDQLALRGMGEYAAALFYLLEIHDAERIEATLRGTKFPVAEMRLCHTLLASPLWQLSDNPDRQAFKEAFSLIKHRERLAHVRFFRAMRAASMNTRGEPAASVQQFRTRIAELYYSVVRSREPLYVSDLALDGTEIAQMGFRGPAVGAMLEKLRQAVLQNPALNTNPALRELLLREKNAHTGSGIP